MWEWLWIVSQTLKAEVLCTQAHFSLKMQGYEQQGETIILGYIKICDESDSFIIRIKVWLVHKCSSLFQCNSGLEKCFLVHKLYQETEGICWHPKLAHIRFAGQSGQTGQTCHGNRSDRSRQVCHIVNWTSPLRRSHWDDRNAYIEHPIWTPDEEVMPPGRPAPWSDRPRGGQTGSETGQTGPKRPIRVRSCILTRDL